MRHAVAVAVLLLSIGPVAAQKDDKPIPPAEAARKIGELVTVEMKVQSSRFIENKGVAFLNSEEDFRNEKNFSVMVSKKAVARYKKMNIDDVATHFVTKTIRVTGTIALYKDKAEIVVNDPKQIQLLDDKK
jgi:DNA/RNA endonuclease YhcR with UshA esterase domain